MMHPELLLYFMEYFPLRLHFNFQGKPTTLVWAYGMANKFSRIKHDIGSSWKSKEFLLFGKRGQEPSQKIGEIAENQNNHLKEKPTENKIKKNKNKDKKVKIKHNGKSNVSGDNFD